MKKFFAEFKKFITRGNVMDMAVGVIVGSSFTAIVNALSNNILIPVGIRMSEVQSHSRVQSHMGNWNFLPTVSNGQYTFAGCRS